MQNNTFSTLFVGQNLIKLKEVDSTNNFLKDLLSKSEPLAEGTVIMADNQFSGRGQQQSVWQTEAGKNISMSIYLKPSFLPLQKQFYLNMAVSLAVSDALDTYITEGIKIKWPNDIYYFNRKIGGILIENTLTGIAFKSSVIGIGLNINQLNFPDHISNKATSLVQILQKETDLMGILEKISIFIEKYYLILKSGGYDILQKNYLKRLYNFNVKASYLDHGKVFEGIITGVEDGGRLVMHTEQGPQAFNFKEIEFIHTK
ncbi:BirA family biotin operon repressor/biotin-[acetyl-CoA-carboxylase] ligase [Pedobacter psychrotolerans]|uniref:Biotin--[acetyl-CoA-carboxylase] ligase n=1 Tax=Pedobacter psychrotolerans TaxID=1843235 RepID=A0A4R2HEW6_9SPHI|nr:biotin--[acetyl-CoA-carboxylase] ligase [Pedobacter psychrotolerans]TCO27002.1 BirA family biotin operon repressor/biotin-[acetyl-CoA-carboxylase] ligase [Pedobacter psychrotolerans]GGE58164.1 biotin--[acetyl-CoA-carboxylase] ligase [Pedobacter psychrotolerans]